MKDEFRDSSHHFWLTRSMAKTAGVNLVEELACKRLTTEDYLDLFTACRLCGKTDFCENWLSEVVRPFNRVPKDCAISETLNRLAVNPHQLGVDVNSGMA